MEGNAGGVVLRSEFEVAMDSSTSVIFFLTVKCNLSDTELYAVGILEDCKLISITEK